jgi:hypothetical protein
MSQKIIISLHGGMGDVIKTFPFINQLLKRNFNVTLQTKKYFYPLVNFFLMIKFKL